MRDIKFRAWNINQKQMFWWDLLWGNHRQGDGYIGMVPWGEKQTRHIHRDNMTLIDPDDCVLMQFTGLRDKNGLTDIYEGDILDENGVIRGNVYESPQIFREGIDFVIAGMGTSAWRSSESIAMGRGCKYTE